MSTEPPFTTPQPALLPPPATHQHLPLLPTTTTAAAGTVATISSNTPREYRKGNWTIEETLILITAKKLDDERRSRPNVPSSSSSVKPAELRWKWVENYCCGQGCFRSQNQCNDKWDNLLRDYKKVREYQSRSESSSSPTNLNPSYWNMERHQRKDSNLPSNMSFEVYEALNEVVQRKYTNALQPQQRVVLQQQQPHHPQPPQQPQPEQPQPQQQHFFIDSSAAVPVTVRPPAPPAGDPLATSDSESSGTESSEKLDTTSKRRKVQNLGTSIRQSASILADTIRTCEDKRDKRHQELMELEHRRLRLEETQIEVNRQGVANVVAAINNLSTAIQSLISHRT